MAVGDENVAVVAHGLLNSMTAVIGAMDLAIRVGGLQPEVEQALAAGKRQAELVNESLRQLVQGLPPDTLDLTRPRDE